MALFHFLQIFYVWLNRTQLGSHNLSCVQPVLSHTLGSSFWQMILEIDQRLRIKKANNVFVL